MAPGVGKSMLACKLGHQALIEGRRAVPAVSVSRPAAAVLIAWPTDGSPEQAVAVFEILDELRERVWAHYGRRLQQVLREQRCTTASTAVGNIDAADIPF